jgi:hypothetical protein
MRWRERVCELSTWINYLAMVPWRAVCAAAEWNPTGEGAPDGEVDETALHPPPPPGIFNFLPSLQVALLRLSTLYMPLHICHHKQ